MGGETGAIAQGLVTLLQPMNSTSTFDTSGKQLVAISEKGKYFMCQFQFIFLLFSLSCTFLQFDSQSLYLLSLKNEEEEGKRVGGGCVLISTLEQRASVGLILSLLCEL